MTLGSAAAMCGEGNRYRGGKVVCHPINWCHCKGLNFMRFLKSARENESPKLFECDWNSETHAWSNCITWLGIFHINPIRFNSIICFSHPARHLNNNQSSKIKINFRKWEAWLELQEKTPESSRPFNMFILLNNRLHHLSSFILCACDFFPYSLYSRYVCCDYSIDKWRTTTEKIVQWISHFGI